ncbi:uncharacterized protein LOC110103867 [Dendrobium catenatum]|uniref:uncharacterized protein LOC110103867 n=1 Tax=Dendrobium catenatum TaxID=906689 RepID=UPI0009F6F275|nr:uncharacterized protein LOC110103867 [Dendrobium catenatum]
MDDHVIPIPMPGRFRSRRMLFMIGIIASLILVFHTFTLPYRSVSLPVLPSLKKEEIFSGEATSLESKRLNLFSLLSDTQNSTYPKVILKELESTEINDASGRTAFDFRDELTDVVSEKVLLANVTDHMEDIDLDSEISLDFKERPQLKDFEDQISWSVTEDEIVDQNDIASTEVAKKAGNDFAFKSQNNTDLFSERNRAFHEEVIVPLKAVPSSNNGFMKEALAENSSSHVAMLSELVISSLGGNEADCNSTECQMKGTGLTNKTQLAISSISSSSSSAFDSKNANIHITKMRPGKLPVSVSEMKQLMLAYRSSNHQKWHSKRDKQLIAAKALLQNTPVVKNDEELFEPAFWNISWFKSFATLPIRLL